MLRMSASFGWFFWDAADECGMPLAGRPPHGVIVSAVSAEQPSKFTGLCVWRVETRKFQLWQNTPCVRQELKSSLPKPEKELAQREKKDQKLQAQERARKEEEEKLEKRWAQFEENLPRLLQEGWLAEKEREREKN